MKILKKVLFVSVLGLLPTMGLAQDLKIGVVNPSRLLEEAPQAKVALNKLEKEFSARDNKLLKEQKAIKQDEEKLARDGAIMSEAERRKLERDILSRKRDLRRALDELREDRTFRSNEERGKLLRYVNDAITQVGKQEKYDLILYEGIAFANPNIDLTGMILKRLQNEAKAKK
ncbi:OmpH family outer membrane protein [Sulfuriflexus sp.]|uniref:OmpH family outer membrane protein n=1 Tax=Sulfuriflexus sp. TaxID=2015443 RepID=UPI0028CC9291|nr:OmpH family outer membrane protein [Sulfuriflexus sp.]MDT8402977.1 OmpH family outer membrane protein [Sulfuriflexus sp.]